MIYRFGEFALDTGKVELRLSGQPVAVEPQVFELILLLIQNADRMVSKDEIIQQVWNGRIVSEAAVASRVKSARQVLGDDGKAQRVIKTIHGRGFRFVAELDAAPAGTVITARRIDLLAPNSGLEPAKPERPSIAVLPFHLIGIAGDHASIADALPHDLISQLSRLKWLFVIARGSSFKFRAADPDIRQVGAVLGVRYCLTGTIEITGKEMIVMLELADTRDASIVWAERYVSKLDQIHEVRSQIVASVITSLELQITTNEARLARLKSPENLDVWSAYHLGLQHLYRFNKTDNSIATGLFTQAIQLDPDFARAHAGLSSTHFQNAFMQYNQDVDAEADAARRFAERSLELDALDPFANFTMGRTYWLDGDLDGSMSWLERATQLNPNYAQGIYSRAWADSISGRGLIGQENVDTAISLSPLDPFLYAMIGTRAFSHIVREEDEAAAQWAEKAARSPQAHVMIEMIAVAAHALHGADDKARYWADRIQRGHPGLTHADFFHSFPFKDPQTRQRITGALSRFGF